MGDADGLRNTSGGRTFRVMRSAAALALVGVLSACGAAETFRSEDRCVEVEEAGDAQAAAAQVAVDRATRAKGDEQRAEADLRRAEYDAGFPSTPELSAAASDARRAWNTAQEAHAAARDEVTSEFRIAAQIIVGDPECFDPKTVATAREYLD